MAGLLWTAGADAHSIAFALAHAETLTMFERTPRGWRPQEWLHRLPPACVVLAAVSGGADSCALAVLLAETLAASGHRLEIAHVHHGLRGADADADRSEVARLAAILEVPFHETLLDAAGLGWAEHSPSEAAMREERYRALHAIAAKIGAAVIALGHQQEDAAENFLLMALRGAGPAGLASLRIVRADGGRPILLRPLLRCARAELERILIARGFVWRKDASNDDLRFRRNALRASVLPMLRAIEPAVVEALARSSSNCADAWELVEPVVEEALHNCARGTAEELFLLHREPLAALAPPLRRELLRAAFRRIGVLPSARFVEDSAEAIPADIPGERTLQDEVGPAATIGPDWVLLRGDGATRADAEGLRDFLAGHWNVAVRAASIERRDADGTVEFIVRGAEPGLGVARFPRQCVADPVHVRTVDPEDRLLLPEGGSKTADAATKDAKIPVVLRAHLQGVYAAGRLLWIPGVRRSAVDRNDN